MMAVMRWIGGAIVLVGAGWVAGACGASVFACSSDAQCQSGGVAGMCQPDGYCSFPDESCPSGQRFGEAAPSGVANACVEPSEATGSSTSLGPDAGSDGTEPPDPEGTTTAAVDDGPTTMPVSDGTSTGPIPEPTGMASEGTGASEACRTVFVDPFDDAMLSPMWTTFARPGTELWVQDGQLAFSVGPASEWIVAGAIFELDSLTGGWVRANVTEADDSGLLIAGGVVVANEICHLQMYIDPGGLAATIWNDETLTSTTLDWEEDPGVPLWLQIRLDEGGESHFEWSSDAITWNELAGGTFPECGDFLAGVVTGVNVGGEPVEGVGTRRFEQFELCLP
jgi:hypothetical protein